jgi:uncharacterized membrane protein YeaQ/YmgE (transglycosylase-associated protein family)
MDFSFIIGLILLGLVAGALGRLIVPGRDPMGILMTIVVGIAGALIGGFVGRAIFGEDAPGFLLAVAFAALIVFVMRKVRR